MKFVCSKYRQIHFFEKQFFTMAMTNLTSLYIPTYTEIRIHFNLNSNKNFRVKPPSYEQLMQLQFGGSRQIISHLRRAIIIHCSTTEFLRCFELYARQNLWEAKSGFTSEIVNFLSTDCKIIFEIIVIQSKLRPSNVSLERQTSSSIYWQHRTVPRRLLQKRIIGSSGGSVAVGARVSRHDESLKSILFSGDVQLLVIQSFVLYLNGEGYN